MSVLVTSYFSPEYVFDVQKLFESCRRFSIPHKIQDVQAFDSWQDGVAFKPAWIYEQLCEIPEGSGLLWTDADSEFVRKPDFSVFNAIDIACCQFQWSKNHTVEFLTGTFFARHIPRVLDFVKRWMLATPTWRKTCLDTPEQNSLRETYELQKNHPNALRYLNLPKEWVWITPEFDTMYPNMAPLIRHHQASRRVRK